MMEENTEENRILCLGANSWQKENVYQRVGRKKGKGRLERNMADSKTAYC